MSKHIKLTVGADIEASVSNFRSDLNKILAGAGADPLKIKVDIDDASLATAVNKIKSFADKFSMSTGNGKSSGAFQGVAQSAETAGSKITEVTNKANTQISTVLSNAQTAATSSASSVVASINQMFTAIGQKALPASQQPSQLLLPEYSSAPPSYMRGLNFSQYESEASRFTITLQGVIDKENELLALPARGGSSATSFAQTFADIPFEQFINGTNSAGITWEDFISRLNKGSLNNVNAEMQELVANEQNVGSNASSVEHAGDAVQQLGNDASAAQPKLTQLWNIWRLLGQGGNTKFDLTDNLDPSMVDEYTERLNRLKSLLEQIHIVETDMNGAPVPAFAAWDDGTALSADEITRITQAYNDFLGVRKQALSGGKQTIIDQREAAAAQRSAEAVSNLTAEISRYITSNKSLMSSSQLGAFQKLYSGLKSGSLDVHDATLAFNRLKTEIDSSTNVVQKFFNQFSTSILSRLSTSAISAGFAALSKAVRTVYQDVIDLDKAIVDLQVATGYSREQTAGLVKEYSALGNELGATTVEVAQAADEWLRQGYSAQESEELIRQSMILSKLGQIEASEATTALTSAINGYGKTVSDAAGIVDMLTAVDMEAAASAGGLAVAMSRTATGANTAGVSMQTLIGWIAKVKEVTQDSDEAVGTFFKTMVARMGNIKSKFLIDPETGEDLSDVESVLSGVDIQLRDSEEHFRDLEVVLGEVGDKWSEYSNVQKRAIAKAFAGTRQQEKFLVLMENYSDAMKLADVAANSSGTAMEKFNNAYLKSYEAAKNSLTASGEAFSQSILNTDGIITAINALNNLVQVFTKLNEVGATFPIATFVAGFATIARQVHSFSSALSAAQTTVAPLLSTLGQGAYQSKEFGDAINGVVAALQGQSKGVQQAVLSTVSQTNANAALLVSQKLNASAESEITAAILSANAARTAEIAGVGADTLAIAKEVVSQNAAAIAIGERTKAQLVQIAVSKGAVESEAEIAIESLLAAAGIKTADGATKKFSASLAALKASGAGATLAISAIVAGVYLLTRAIKYLSESTKRGEEALEGYKSELEQNESELDSLQTKLKENKKRIQEISQIEKPTLIEQAELDNLEEENQKLATNIVLLKNRKKVLKDNQDKEEEKLYKKAGKSGLGHDNWVDDSNGYTPRYMGTNPGTTRVPYIDTKTAIKQYTEGYKEAVEAQNKYYESHIKGKRFTEDEEKEYERLTERVKAYEDALDQLSSKAATWGDAGSPYLESIAYTLADAEEKVDILTESVSGLNTESAKTDLSGISSVADVQKKLDEQKISDYALEVRKLAASDMALHEAIDGMNDEQVVEFLAKLLNIINAEGDAADDAADQNDNLKTSISSLDEASKGLKAVQQAIRDMNDDGKVAFSTIADIASELKGAGVDDSKIDDWTHTLATASSKSAAFKQAMSELTYEFVKQKVGVENLTSEKKDYIKSLLDEYGVANSAAVANQIVAEAEAQTAVKAAIASGNVSQLKAALESEAGQAALTSDAFVRLVAEMIAFNTTNLDVSQKLEALRALASQAGVTEAAIASMLDGGDIMGEAVEEYAKTYGVDTRGRDESYKETKEFQDIYGRIAMEHFSKSLENRDSHSPPVVDYVPTKTSGSSGGGSKSDTALKKYQKSVDAQAKSLEVSYKKGEISAATYFKKMESIYSDGYNELARLKAAGAFSDSDEDEILDAEVDMLDKMKGAHTDAYNDEKKQIDHYLKMNYITEEQHYAELARLYLQYYAGREEYAEEAMAAEEELYETGTAIVEKWAGAAVDAVNAVADAMQSMASAATDLLQGLIDANEHSFDRYYKNLQHELKMNYITEAEYTDRLNKLYKRYFKDKYIYLEQYQQYEEEVYEAEQQALQDAASATEDIHAKVVDMIRDELEEQKDAIDETKDAYLELIDIRRQALNEQKDQEDYEKQHAEKLAAVAELQRQLNALANDQSAEGVRRYNETLNSLHDAQEELYDFEREHAYDTLEKQLDDQEEALEESASAHNEQIDKLLEDNEWLVAEAWRRMEGMSDELYNQLIAHNKKYSTSIKDDITDSWDTAYNAMKRYYDGVNAEGAYKHITGRVGESGMTDAEAQQYNNTVAIKNVAEYVNVFAKAIAAFASAGASLVSSFASILNTVFPNPLTSLMATGAGGMASAVGAAGNIFTTGTGFFAGLAGGSDSVSATGIYRTDEFGEEAKLLRTSDGNYSFLTKGSKVFTARQTERLAKILEHPELLSGGLAPGLIPELSKALASTSFSGSIDASSQNVTLSQQFNITGDDPKTIANEIKDVVADYTLDVIRRNARAGGRTRLVSSVY